MSAHKKWCGLKDDPNFVQCCCNCKYHVPTYRRWPWWIRRTFQILRLPRLPLFMPGNKWACVAYDLSHVETHWPAHSCGCEIYTPVIPHDQHPTILARHLPPRPAAVDGVEKEGKAT